MASEDEHELRPVRDEFHEEYESVVEEVGQDIPDRLFMEIREAPKKVSNELKARYRGYRSHIIDDVQLVFVCCDECIGNGHVDRIACDDCEDIHGENQASPQGEMIKLFHIRNIEPHNRAA